MSAHGSVREGQPAPDFELPSDEGGSVRLSELRGRKIILYFYPKDDTSGCTIQACDFRDRLERIDEKGARVLGVSPDDIDSHRKFKAKYDLNFPLLADTDHAVAERYGVWKEKSMYGRKYMGVERSTFIIDEEGRVEKALRGVKAQGHADALLSDL